MRFILLQALQGDILTRFMLQARHIFLRHKHIAKYLSILEIQYMSVDSIWALWNSVKNDQSFPSPHWRSYLALLPIYSAVAYSLYRINKLFFYCSCILRLGLALFEICFTNLWFCQYNLCFAWLCSSQLTSLFILLQCSNANNLNLQVKLISMFKQHFQHGQGFPKRGKHSACRSVVGGRLEAVICLVL